MSWSGSVAKPIADNQQTSNAFSNQYYDSVSTYRLIWPDVTYQPGQLKAIAYKGDKRLGQAIVNTASQPAKLRLTADRTVIDADGMDLCYVTIEMTDKDGNLCPWAMDNLTFTVEGPAKLIAVGNGNQMGFDSFTDNTHRLFYGKAVAILRSTPDETGKAVLKVKSESGVHAKISIVTTSR